MSVPKSRSLGRDVSDLWGRERARGVPRDRGWSSWDAGEGADEVRDPSGNPVAMIGEAGSVRGFLVPDGAGGWRTVQADAQARADAALTSAGGQVAALQSTVSALQSTVSALQSTVSSLQTRLSTAEGNITTLAGSLTATRTALNAAISIFDTRLRALEGSSPGPKPPTV